MGFCSGVEGRLGFLPTGRSGLRLAGSTAAGSLLFSNMEISDVVGGREVVSVARLSALAEPLLGDASTGCRRGDPFHARVLAPWSEATAPVPGLALRLAANVAAMKLALFTSVDFPLLLPPNNEESEEGRKSAWRSLSLSAASPRRLEDPVFCLLIPPAALKSVVWCCLLLLSWLGVRLGFLCTAVLVGSLSCRGCCCCCCFCCFWKASEAPLRAASCGERRCGGGGGGPWCALVEEEREAVMACGSASAFVLGRAGGRERFRCMSA